MGKDIDAVTVSTPDHHHGIAGIRSLKMGKHLFCQKPLTQTVSEARLMRNLAKEKNLATQMGNQGSSEDGLRRAVEVVQAGVIGKPLELHVWSNRPVWPQALNRPEGSDPVPDNLNWDLWLGPARERPYKKDLSMPPSNGAAGMTSAPVPSVTWPATPSTCPSAPSKWATPASSNASFLPACIPKPIPRPPASASSFPPARASLRSNSGGTTATHPDDQTADPFTPLRPEAEVTREIITMLDKLPGSGCLVIGDKGKVFSPDDYGAKFFVVQNGKDNYVAGDQDEACKAVPQTIPRNPSTAGITERHMSEWFTMMRDGTPSYSNFDIAGYLAEVILLGCVALRVGEGKRMEWDGPGMKSPNLPEAAQFVKRQNREGWDV